MVLLTDRELSSALLEEEEEEEMPTIKAETPQGSVGKSICHMR